MAAKKNASNNKISVERNKNKSVLRTETKKAEPVVEKMQRRNILRLYTKMNWRNNIVAAVLLASVSLFIYARSIDYEYVLDDKLVITNNTFVQRGISGISDIFNYESFRGYFGDSKTLLEGGRYRPFSIATFAIEQSLFGVITSDRKLTEAEQKTLKEKKEDAEKILRPERHLLNCILYVLGVLFLYRVLLLLFPQEDEDPKLQSQSAKLLSNIPFLAAFLFAIHPTHIEVVANIKGRDELLALIFELGALYFAIRYTFEKRSRLLVYLFMSALLGLLSKEGVLVFAVLIPLTLYFFTKADRKSILIPSVIFLVAVFFYLIVRTNAIGFLVGDKEITDPMNNPFAEMDFVDKYATIFYTLLLYLKLLIIPFPLTHDYYPYQIPRMTWASPFVLVSLFIHLGLAFYVIKNWKSKSVMVYSILFYLIALSIVSNIFISVGTFMNDRFLFHASIGFCILIAFVISNFSKNNVFKWSGSVAFCAYALLLIYLQQKRLPDWQNPFTLEQAAVKYSPNSARSNCFYATALFERRYLKFDSTATTEQKKALLDSMKPYLEKSMTILPKYYSAYQMYVGMSTEYYKLDENLDNLLFAYNRSNKSGAYDPFILKFLGYLNGHVSTKSDGDKLVAFYTDNLNFYKKNNPNTILPGTYQKLLDQFNARLPFLR